MRDVPCLFLFFGFIIFSIIAAFFGKNESIPFLKVFWGIYKIVSFAFVYIVVVVNLSMLKDFRITIRLLIIGMVFASAIAISQKLFGYGFHFFSFGITGETIEHTANMWAHEARAIGSMRSPNEFAGLLLLPISMLAGIVLSFKDNFKNIKGYILAFLILFLGLLSTLSRAGWAAIFFSFCIIAIFFRVKKYLILAPFAVILLFSINSIFPGMGGTLLGRADTVAEGGFRVDAMTARYQRWNFFLEVMWDNPMGLGSIPAGHFQEAAQPHNTYIHLAIISGIPGLIIGLAILLNTLKNAYKNYLNIDDKLIKGVFAGVCAGTVAFLIHGFFESLWQNWQQGVLIWFIAGITMAARRTISAKRYINRPIIVRTC
jgi:O-antigen ligase